MTLGISDNNLVATPGEALGVLKRPNVVGDIPCPSGVITPLQTTFVSTGIPLLVYNDISTPEDSRTPIDDSSNFKNQNAKTKQGSRLFCTLQSGLLWNARKSLRFMTLTSADESPKDVQRSFNRLVTTIRRTTPADLVDNGYIRYIGRFYQDKLIDEPLNLDYMAVETSEGNGVIHALMTGDYLPHDWLSDQWKIIHKAWNVDIRRPKGEHGNQKIARYILAQYVKGQEGIKRVTCSQNWIYPGWRDDLKRLIAENKERDQENGYKKAIHVWDMCMLTQTKPYEVYMQSQLFAGMTEEWFKQIDLNYTEWLLNGIGEQTSDHHSEAYLELVNYGKL